MWTLFFHCHSIVPHTHTHSPSFFCSSTLFLSVILNVNVSHIHKFTHPSHPHASDLTTRGLVLYTLFGYCSALVCCAMHAALLTRSHRNNDIQFWEQYKWTLQYLNVSIFPKKAKHIFKSCKGYSLFRWSPTCIVVSFSFSDSANSHCAPKNAVNA